MRPSNRRQPAPVSRSAFSGFRFPAEVTTVAVRWYLRYGLSYRDVEELLAERDAQVDHVTVYRCVQRFTPLFADAARFTRIVRVIGGSSTRPTRKSTACGATSTGPSTGTDKSLTSWSRSVATERRLAGSSAAH